VVQTSTRPFVTLLPTKSTYRRFVEEIRGGFLLRGLPVDHITADSSFIIKSPKGSITISDEDGFLMASDLLRKTFRLKLPAVHATQKLHSVWLLARPLGPALQIGVADFLAGKYPLSHWGVLVTHLPTKEVGSLISHSSPSPNSTVVLGDLYEVFQEPGRMKSANITSPFGIKHLTGWPRLSMKYVGITTSTRDEIERKGNLSL